VRVRYREYSGEDEARERRYQRFRRVFMRILLVNGGDAEDALDRIERHGRENGLFATRAEFQEFRRRLEEEGFLKRGAGGGFEAGAGAGRAVREDALKHIFSGLRGLGSGEHRTAHSGEGLDPLPETRPWRFGDCAQDIAWLETFKGSYRRAGIEDWNLREEDFEVHEKEHLANCATVLLLDISHSMVLYGEDRITPAKQVAMALAELIRVRYPRDALDVAVFGDDAERIAVGDLIHVTAGPYHTNTRAALQLAHEILQRRKHQNRQVFLVTDGKPSAITEEGMVYKNPFGLDPRIVNKTLDEAARLRRSGIPITTFMIASDPYLQGFVRQLTEVNRGRAYFASPENLSAILFIDYLRGKQRTVG